MAMTLSCYDIVQFLGQDVIEIIGDSNRSIPGVSPICDCQGGELSFLSSAPAEGVPLLKESKAGLVICGEDYRGQSSTDKTLILVKRPRFSFVRTLDRFFSPVSLTGTHPSSIVHPEAQISKTAYIGPFCIIGRAVIGDGCQLLGHVSIGDRVTIGKNVIVKQGTVLGGDGFGYEKAPDGSWIKFPHLGGITVEDGVHIGSNTCIDRGTLGTTLIKKGARIDNLVHVAHNVVIGENCIIVACAEISGSVKLGDRVWVSPNASILNGVTVGDDAFVGIHAVATRSLNSKERLIPAFSEVKGPKK